jgi:protein O-GlcNAc transferase
MGNLLKYCIFLFTFSSRTMNIDKSTQLALTHYKAGNIKEAENICRKILKKQPKNFNLLHFFGIIHDQLGNHDLAIKYIQKALHFNSNMPEAYHSLGNAFQANGQFDDAITCYQKALKLNPNLSGAYNCLGNTLQAKGQLDDAITYYQKAIELDGNFYGAYHNLGNVLESKGEIDEAITCYQKALNLNPNLVDAYCSLGDIFQNRGQPDEAITCYQKALNLNPNLSNTYNNLGIVLKEKGQLANAIKCFQNALQLNPDFAKACGNLVNLLQETCCWQELQAMTAELDSLTKKALNTGTKPGESPFHNIIRHADPAVGFAIAMSWSCDIAIAMSNLNMHFSFDDRRTNKTKIVIGYLSNDFHNHPTAHLMLSLFGLHDRNAFEIYCYSYGKDDGSYYRERIQHDCDKFVDISNLSYSDAAKCIYEDRVDILVDLKGYTMDNRLDICGLRPAPVQVNYLGFPASTGADFIDYIITDKIVTPKDHAPYYSENFVYLPHCYQVNDHTQSIATTEWEKDDFRLPESCFVFCSFNRPYKIDSVMFDVWMKILKKVPESVLWLLFGNRIAEDNLRREAEARGVKSERLIFAEMLQKDEHLGRMRLADLALDTRIVNGHTTTSDALWAGVPVITLQGGHFVSRVSSSILSAIGLPELITHSLEEYEALAVRLANNPYELQKIRQGIVTNRTKAPLFDTPRFVRNLETAYKEIWKIFLAGDVPRQIEVLES